MPVPQQKFREIVFQLLYSYDLGRASEEDMLPLLMKELAVTRKVVRSAQEKVRKIIEKQNEIDEDIARISKSYEFERIQSVERNILRLGVYEMLYDDDIPPKVAIAEGMRLARKFGTPESASFINALLDHLYKHKLGQSGDQNEIEQSLKALIQSEENARKAAEESPLKSEEESG